MVWIESVRSLRYHARNTSASVMAKTVVVVASATLYLSVRLSVMSVPTMLSSTTASQYTRGTYRRSRNWKKSTTTSTALITHVVPVNPRPRLVARLSAAVSPTVVARILMIQKKMVTSGTLFNMVRATRPVVVLVIALALLREGSVVPTSGGVLG